MFAHWDKKNNTLKKFKEKSRDRFLHPDELPRFFESLASEGRFRMSRVWDLSGAEVWYNLNFNDDEMRFVPK